MRCNQGRTGVKYADNSDCLLFEEKNFYKIKIDCFSCNELSDMV